MELKTLEWKNNALKIIDQRLLPYKLKYVYIKNIKQLYQAIKTMQIRGAPALGVSACFGVYLGVKDFSGNKFSKFKEILKKTISYIGSSRPTARNLFEGLERVYKKVMLNRDKPIPKIKQIILETAEEMLKEEMISCRRIAYFGEKLIKKNESILTICNTGILATIDYGTALGVVYSAYLKGKNPKVYACETRPLLQGARLTCWELKKKGIIPTLICDSMAGTLLSQRKIDKVIVGADRIASNGDTANKIGTLSLAVLSKHFGVDFYVAAPKTTFDLSIPSGQFIKIEERDPSELTCLYFKKPIAPEGIKVFNPAFDITPAKLITAFITDYGIIRPPFNENIRKVLKC